MMPRRTQYQHHEHIKDQHLNFLIFRLHAVNFNIIILSQADDQKKDDDRKKADDRRKDADRKGR